MEIIVGISGATTVASLLVALFKLGVPAASSALIAGIAFLAGQLGAALVTMASTGLAGDQKTIATVVVTGILAAAAAAGISRTDQSAEKARTNPPGGDTKTPTKALASILLVCLLLPSMLSLQGCGPGTLHQLHTKLNVAAKTLNAAAKTNHQFYDGGIYGPVGTATAIAWRQKGAAAVHDSNEYLIQALTLAQQLTPATFEQGKLAVLDALSKAAGSLHVGNQSIDLVLQGVATIINQAVVLIEAFKSSDLRYALPEIRTWQIERVTI